MDTIFHLDGDQDNVITLGEIEFSMETSEALEFRLTAVDGWENFQM